jgi:hypothetical protein
MIPNPGSPKAVELGCTCAIYDNHNGWGSDYGKDKFWIARDCPIHGADAE